jgi:hypothetical protein
MAHTPKHPAGLFFHIVMEQMVGVEKHLRDVHRLPEELIDVDDIKGMGADHVVLHGGHLDAAGRIWFDDQTWP